jgi:3-deoxy-alpha-D-manno-octulosonate 8-oxidase
VKLSKNIPTYTYGAGALATLGDALALRRRTPGDWVAVFIDEFFRDDALARTLPLRPEDLVEYCSTKDEPTTEYVDEKAGKSRGHGSKAPCAVVGIGGGITLDIAKAVSNLHTNPGKAEDYQGWDLVKAPGVFKIGVPTLSGTGAESSRTCVMTNHRKNVKLGMNSEFTMYDHLILDPNLSATVPRNQYFYTGMDAYIHCIESLGGRYKHALADAFSHQCLTLCREVFGSQDMQTPANREKLMVASYLGGAAIANTFVGVVHPLSAALSTVFHYHHGIANCIVMNVMEEFYPKETAEFHAFVDRQGITLPKKVTGELTDDGFRRLYDACIQHEKPLTNALGEDFRKVLTVDKAISLFKRM